MLRGERIVAEVLLPEPAALTGTDALELDFSLGCQGRLDAGEPHELLHRR